MTSVSPDYMKHINESSTNQLNNIATMIATYITTNNEQYPVNQSIIIDRLLQLIEECASGDTINRCIECGIDMGIDNPRQYCCKTYCGSAGY